MLKKFITLSILITLLIGCSLPNRAPAEITTEAQLNLSFQLPGDSIETSDNTRMLLTETSTVEIILYKPFEEDTLTVDSTPTAAAVANLSNSEQVIAERVSFSSGSQVNHSIDNIPLGNWHILIGSFLSETPQWQDTDLGIPGPVSFAVYENLILEAGSNQLALTLAPNLDYGNSIDVTTNTSGSTFISESNLAESMVIDLYNMDNTQTYGVNYAIDAALDGLVELAFYTPDGVLLPVTFTDGYAELDMTLLGNELVATVRGTSGLNLQNFERLQINITPTRLGPALNITISTYEIPPNLTLTLDGLILPDADRIEAYLYQTFTGDPISGGAVPEENDLLTIASNNSGTIFFANALNPGNSAELIFNDANISTGTWNLVVAALDADAERWSDIDNVPTAQSFAWGEGLTLVNGDNAHSLTLRPNSGYGSYNPIDPMDGAYFQWDGTKVYSASYVSALTAGTPVTFTMDEGLALAEIWSNIQFYNGSGELQTISPVVNGTEYSWTYTPVIDNEELYLLFTPNSSNYSSMDIEMLPVTGGFSINIVGYTDLSLQLNGLLLSDTAVVDVMIYESSLSSTLAAINNDSDMSIFRSRSDVYTKTVPIADLTGDNEILVDTVPTNFADPQIQVSAIPNDYWDDINTMITSWFYVTDVLSVTSFIRDTGVLDLSGSLSSHSVTLAPNISRYTTYDIGTNPSDFLNWDPMYTSDYFLIFFTGFSDGNTYPLTYTLEKSLSMMFSGISFYDQSGNSIPLVREHTLTSTGVKNSWNFVDTIAVDTLAVVMEIDRINADRFIPSNIATDFSASTGGITFVQGDMGYTNNGLQNFYGIEQSMMTSALASLEVIMYEGSPITDIAPTQADIEEILASRIYQRKVFGISGSTELSASGSIEYQTGTWNTIIGTFMDSDHTSWEGTISDRDGATTTAPIYLSYEVKNGVEYTTGNIISVPTLLMNQERFYYETGGWGTSAAGGGLEYTYFNVASDTFSYNQQDYSNVPITLIASGFTEGINKVYLGNMDGLTGNFDFSIFGINGAFLGTTFTYTLTSGSDGEGNYFEFNIPDPSIPYVFVLFPKFDTQSMGISVISSPVFEISHTYTGNI